MRHLDAIQKAVKNHPIHYCSLSELQWAFCGERVEDLREEMEEKGSETWKILHLHCVDSLSVSEAEAHGREDVGAVLKSVFAQGKRGFFH